MGLCMGCALIACECRYSLPVVVVVMNNNGIYGGDRRQQILKEAAHKGATAAGFGSDPIPTAFVPDTRSSTSFTIPYMHDNGHPPARTSCMQVCHDYASSSSLYYVEWASLQQRVAH